MNRAPNTSALIAILCAVTVMLVLLALMNGPAPLSVSDVFYGLFGEPATPASMIVREIRLPRALAGFLAGAALGAAGAGLQGLLRNPLADPGVLGVSSSAALGAVLVIYFNIATMGAWIVPGATIFFALGATALLYLLGAGRVSTARLILIGVGLSSFAGAFTSLAINMSPNPFAISDLVNWLFGTVANRSFNDLFLAVPFFVLGLSLMTLAGPGLRALTLGEDAAASLGANLKHMRILTIVGAAMLVGASVSLAGAIGFVGIVAPHLMRGFVNHDPARLILPSAIMGGIILLTADIFIRLMPFDQELKLGVAAALIGAPGFVWVAATTKRMSA